VSEIYYIISETFDYDRLICDDAGPAYAKRQGWTCVPLRDAHQVASKPHVFDNRLSNSDLDALESHVTTFANRVVFIKVVDPRLETISQPFYQRALALVKKPNLQLIGPYHATGITELAQRVAGREIYRFFPYAYDPARERLITQPGKSRRRKLFLTGAIVPGIYSDRVRFYKAQRWTWWGSRLVIRLSHPGYPDIGDSRTHAHIGDHFIDLLSAHAGMWVDGADNALELLKYTECAYAGCAPFGMPASTLPPDAAAEVWPIPAGREAQALRAGLSRSVDALAASASRYREALRYDRAREVWNPRLIEWWSLATLQLSHQHVSIA
jgi:hypothetical protein